MQGELGDARRRRWSTSRRRTPLGFRLSGRAAWTVSFPRGPLEGLPIGTPPVETANAYTVDSNEAMGQRPSFLFRDQTTVTAFRVGRGIRRLRPGGWSWCCGWPKRCGEDATSTNHADTPPRGVVRAHSRGRGRSAVQADRTGECRVSARAWPPSSVGDYVWSGESKRENKWTRGRRSPALARDTPRRRASPAASIDGCPIGGHL